MCPSPSFNIDQLLVNSVLYIFPYTPPPNIIMKQIKAEIEFFMNILVYISKILRLLQYVFLKDKHFLKNKTTIPFQV